MTAGQITNELLVRIPEEVPGARVWRANVVAARAGDRFIRAGIKGQADISGILPDGRRLEIEVKAGKDRMSEAQNSFRRMILECGGVHVIARDVEGALAEIKAALPVATWSSR